MVPLRVNKTDMDRTHTMLRVVDELRRSGEIETKVLLVVWNALRSRSDDPCEHKGNKIPFTPTKVNLDIMDACNKRLVQIARDLPGLFVHDPTDENAFVDTSTAVMRDIADNVLRPSEELGMPFNEMLDQLLDSGKKTMKFQSGDVEYSAAEAVINSSSSAVQNLEEKFEKMLL